MNLNNNTMQKELSEQTRDNLCELNKIIADIYHESYCDGKPKESLVKMILFCSKWQQESNKLNGKNVLH